MNKPEYRCAVRLLLLVTLSLSSCVTTEREASVSSNSPVIPPNKVSALAVDPAEPLEVSTAVGVLNAQQENKAKALAHYVSGLIYRSRDETTRALEEWSQVIQLDPNRDMLRNMVIQEYFRRGEYAKVAEFLELALKSEPKSFSYWTLLSVAYRTDKQWEKARSAAEQAIKLDPTKFPAYQVLFEVAVENHKLEEAKAVLDRAAKQNSTDYHFWISLAEIYSSLQKEIKIPDAKKTITGFYEKALALEPNDVGVLASVADFYATNQNPAKAVEIYGEVLKRQPNAENIRIKQALSYAVLGDKKSAISVLQKVVEHEPLRYQVFSLLGEIFEETKDNEQALTNYRLSLSANAQQLAPHLRIVMIYLKDKKYDETLKELDAAREKFPNTPQINYFYGLVYSEKKEYSKSIGYFDEAMHLASASNPEMLDAVFYYYYGAALERDGQFDKAAVQFAKAIELNPDFAEAYNYLGFMYADKNVKLKEAHDYIERALAYDPNNGAYLDSLGWVFYREGNVNQAIEYLQKAAKIIGDDSAVYEHLGEVYHKMGETNKALQNYKKAVDLDPKNNDIQNKLKLIQDSLSNSNSSKNVDKSSTSAPVNKTP